MLENIEKSLEALKGFNQNQSYTDTSGSDRKGRLKKVLIANRGEIAKRFFLALYEERIPSVAIVADVDIGQSWYDMADEVVYVQDHGHYMNINIVVASALLSDANAIYPGYGFLSENSEFAETIEKVSRSYVKEIIFMGPSYKVMKKVGNKLDARNLAEKEKVCLFSASGSLTNTEEAIKEAGKIGFPVMIKLNLGGGGKGMFPAFNKKELAAAIPSCQRLGKELYSDDTFYLEKLIQEPVHLEVQIFNGHPVGIRKCAVQRNNQKIIEETGDFFLDERMRSLLFSSAKTMAEASGYHKGGGAGTVEFLMDQKTNEVGFLEMNTRLQVEHTVTDETLGIDLAKWQILNFDDREKEIPYEILKEGNPQGQCHAIETRIYAEDPANNYFPSPGKIKELELPKFIGVRCDFGFGVTDTILSNFDPMIGKIIAYASTRPDAIRRLERALGELYVGGINTNIEQLLNIISSEPFIDGSYNNRLLGDNRDFTSYSLDTETSIQIAIFAVLYEYTRKIKQYAENSWQTKNLVNSIFEVKNADFSEDYQVSIQKDNYDIRIIKLSLDSFCFFLNETFLARVEVPVQKESKNDLLVRFGLRSYRAKIYKKRNLLFVKVRGADGKIYFSRVKISSQSVLSDTDPPGMKRAPFQSTFVKLFQKDKESKPLKLGDTVKKGDPVLTIAAMKMETVMEAPISGKISSLLENGDLTKLEIGKTTDGLILGRAIQEGEILFTVSDDSEEKAAKKGTTAKKIKNKQAEKIGSLTGANIILTNLCKEPGRLSRKLVLENSRETLPLIFNFFSSYLKGFFSEERTINHLIELVSEITSGQLKEEESQLIENEISSILEFYLNVKKIFSPALGENFSCFNELNLLHASIQDKKTYQLTMIQEILNDLLGAYQIYDANLSHSEEDQRLKLAFLYLQRSFHHCSGAAYLIRVFIDILGKFQPLSEKTKDVLKRLILEESKEQDDFLAKRARDIITPIGREILLESAKYNVDNNKFANKIAQRFFKGKDGTSAEKKALVYLQKKKHLPILPSELPAWAKEEFEKKIALLKKNFDIMRLFSPIEDLYIYQISRINGFSQAAGAETEEDSRYFFVGVITKKTKNERIKKQDTFRNKSIEHMNICIAKCLQFYQGIKPNRKNWGEVYAFRHPLPMDVTGYQEGVFNYKSILQIAHTQIQFFTGMNFVRLVTILKCESELFSKPTIYKFSLAARENSLHLDLFDDSYENYLYNREKVAPGLVRLFDQEKWPIETWAAHSFDSAHFEEIKLAIIDDVIWTNPKTRQRELKKVGSKIFLGKIEGRDACFYMKDSRVSGGATGDLEGLKYVAACYIAFMKGIPLYVWNDGAGANIKEGMISLNRAAQGFMMNALMGMRPDAARFVEYLKNISDERIQKLVKELDKKFAFDPGAAKSNEGNPFVVAVGIGSSTGLDVYGSSQAAVQIMLDAAESYRVLTGANVIKSITGEMITNYEIGGAKVMGEWTGTVNLIAAYKLQIVQYVRQIQKIFVGGENPGRVVRNQKSVHSSHDFEVLSEKIIKSNVDHSLFLAFNESFHKSSSLVGGFACLGGHHTLIMGSRTDFGIRSFASIIKGKELLQVAYKTGSHQIIFFGQDSYQRALDEDAMILRARKDLSNVFKKKSGLKIHILTHRNAIYDATLHSFADVIIFVKREGAAQETLDLMKGVVPFIVDSISEAFDLCHRIISIMSSARSPVARAANNPKIPTNPSLPYDIIGSVISQVFDKESFLEFYREMNDPVKGPALVTGIARLNGDVVGVIADQPAILGGAPDAFGTEKFRFFTEFLNKNDLPLVMLSNAPGFIPGTKQERSRIQQIGAESLDVNILSHIPVVSAVLNQNYGGRQIQAFSKFLRPGIVYIALQNAIMGVMGAESSFDLFHKKKYDEFMDSGEVEKAASLRENYMNEFREKSAARNDAKNSGVLDWVITDIKDLRDNLIKGLEVSRKECSAFFNN